jgi:hypothetical protein
MGFEGLGQEADSAFKEITDMDRVKPAWKLQTIL